MRILHVSEAYGGGLASAVQEYVSSVPEATHDLAFVERLEAPLAAKDVSMFARSIDLRGRGMKRSIQLKRLVDGGSYDVVHAHSAWGGLYARIAARASRIPIVYTPHCYGFNRQDYPRLVRTAFYLVEKLLSLNTTLVASCSPAESAQSERLNERVPSIYVPNVAAASVPRRAPRPLTRTIRVLGAGRLNAQKDPGFFLACVRAMRAAGLDIEAEWIGDGDVGLKNDLERDGVVVTGWLEREEARSRLAARPAVYLHSALWEGFPVTVLEAHVSGCAVIVRESASYDRMGLPSLFSSPGEAAELVATYSMNDALRVAAWESMAAALSDNRPEVQSARLREAYGRAR